VTKAKDLAGILAMLNHEACLPHLKEFNRVGITKKNTKAFASRLIEVVQMGVHVHIPMLLTNKTSLVFHGEFIG
jgi:hypothetical protein